MQRTLAHPTHRPRGFTLVEALAAVVVLGVLMTVALPTFNNSLRKSRRADAVSALTAVQQAQERWRSLHATYAANADLTVAAPTGLGLSASTATGTYNVAISAEDAIGYIVSATATSTGPQAGDTACATMGVSVRGGSIQYGGAPATIDWTATDPDPSRCWNR